MVQTKDGYLWVGTLDGLARFDGVKFKAYMPQVFAGSRSARVRLMVPSRTEGVWIVMDKGPIIRLAAGSRRAGYECGIGRDRDQAAVEDRTKAAFGSGTYGRAAQRLVDSEAVRRHLVCRNAPAGSDSVVAMDKRGDALVRAGWIGGADARGGDVAGV